MQHMTYQPIHSVDPLLCVSYKRAADGSAGSGTEVPTLKKLKVQLMVFDRFV